MKRSSIAFKKIHKYKRQHRTFTIAERIYVLQRKRPIQDHLPGGPADSAHCAGPRSLVRRAGELAAAIGVSRWQSPLAVWARKTGKLPAQALHDKYLIVLDGSPDAWNPQLRFQKAMAAKQAFLGDPNVNQEVLTKKALQAFDGTLALKAFVPSNLKGADEYEDEVIEVNSLLAPGAGKPPFPATAQPQEDHASRIKALIDWLHACGQMQTPLDPHARQRVQEHLAQHVQMLEQQNPDAAQQIKQMLAALENPPPPGMPGTAPLP